MRRQGISGPGARRAPDRRRRSIRRRRRATYDGRLVVLIALGACWPGAARRRSKGPADPTDATYIPRPEWYFLGLFQLLKYFPGKWEVVGAMVIPGIAAGFLALLPWIDRGPDRDPRKRRRRDVARSRSASPASVALTALGWRDRPASAAAAGDTWTPAGDRRPRVRAEG